MYIETTKTQQDVLKLLLEQPEKQFSISSIARTLKKPYPIVHRMIQDLNKKRILKLTSLPPAQMVLIDDQAPHSVLIAIEQRRTAQFLEQNRWMNLYKGDVIRHSNNPFFILLVFGSYAKGTQSQKSDIDLLFIVPKKEDVELMESAANQYTKVKKGIIVVTYLDFLEMTKSNNKAFNVGNEARKYHIVLHSIETYYELLTMANQ